MTHQELSVRLVPLGEPEIGGPAADHIISGQPVFRTWSVEERGNLFAGIWEATPGKWRVEYDEWEYCRIHAGHSIITPDDAPAFVVKDGDSFLLRPGFKGSWEVIETTRKDYVILT